LESNVSVAACSSEICTPQCEIVTLLTSDRYADRADQQTELPLTSSATHDKFGDGGTVYKVCLTFQISLLARFAEYFTSIGSYSRTLTHTRFSLTLRSEEGEYHSLILFRLSSTSYGAPGITNDVAYKPLYAMEAACPHLGADMSHADIEEYWGEDGEDHSTVVVCPWHRQALSVVLRS
jgi:hypothetical protein